MVRAGQLLWRPAPDARQTTRVGDFMSWLGTEHGLRVDDYASLHRWSISDVPSFWSAVWEYFDVVYHEPYQTVLAGETISEARWFVGSTLNFAENVLRTTGTAPAVIARSQTRDRQTLTWDELGDQVARARAGLRGLGVERGDRVAAYLPNIPEALVAFLASASLGAIWSSCPPEFGVKSVVDRFRQIEPKVLLGVQGYRYGGRLVDRSGELRQIEASLPGLVASIDVAYLGDGSPATAGSVQRVRWQELLASSAPLDFDPVPFDHPLVIVFSSGTTGLPKPIVHGHGGLLLEQLKHLGLAHDLGAADRFFWFTTTGWVMWNLLTSALLLETCIVLFDGDPAHPDLTALWQLGEEERITFFGVSAGFLLACRRAGLEPGRDHDLAHLRAVGSTGAPLPVEGYEWVYGKVRSGIPLISGSGGTDIASGFVGGSPLVPVFAGEMSCRALGVDVIAADESGHPVAGERGELIVRQPMPSMPVAFWGDDDGSRRRAAYFDHTPGAWRHGDWITFTERGSCVITGRSDSTLNRGGVRLGSGEFYAIVENLPDVVDSLVVHLEGGETGAGTLVVFVVPADADRFDGAARDRVRQALKSSLSPRHVPDRIEVVAEIPRTLSGKKLEVPVKRILQGADPATAASADSLANPASLEAFRRIGARIRAETGASDG